MLSLQALVVLAALIASGAAVAPKKLIAPAFGEVSSECVHVVESTSDIFEEGDKLFVTSPDGVVTEIPKCPISPPGHGSAWKAWTEFIEANRSVTSLTNEWVVPPAPTNPGDGQTLFFWNGVEPGDNSAVLQPVLQWGVSAGGGGNYWAVASWYVSSAHGTIVTKLINASPGDVIFGGLSSTPNGTWVVTGINKNTNQEASFTYKPKDGKYQYAYEVLEAYNIASCSDYPPSGVESFFGIEVELDNKGVSPNWVAKTQAPITCGEHAKIFNATAVSINFKAG